MGWFIGWNFWFFCVKISVGVSHRDAPVTDLRTNRVHICPCMRPLNQWRLLHLVHEGCVCDAGLFYSSSTAVQQDYCGSTLIIRVCSENIESPRGMRYRYQVHT